MDGPCPPWVPVAFRPTAISSIFDKYGVTTLSPLAGSDYQTGKSPNICAVMVKAPKNNAIQVSQLFTGKADVSPWHAVTPKKDAALTVTLLNTLFNLPDVLMKSQLGELRKVMTESSTNAKDLGGFIYKNRVLRSIQNQASSFTECTSRILFDDSTHQDVEYFCVVLMGNSSMQLLPATDGAIGTSGTLTRTGLGGSSLIDIIINALKSLRISDDDILLIMRESGHQDSSEIPPPLNTGPYPGGFISTYVDYVFRGQIPAKMKLLQQWAPTVTAFKRWGEFRSQPPLELISISEYLPETMLSSARRQRQPTGPRSRRGPNRQIRPGIRRLPHTTSSEETDGIELSSPRG